VSPAGTPLPGVPGGGGWFDPYFWQILFEPDFGVPPFWVQKRAPRPLQLGPSRPTPRGLKCILASANGNVKNFLGDFFPQNVVKVAPVLFYPEHLEHPEWDIPELRILKDVPLFAKRCQPPLLYDLLWSPKPLPPGWRRGGELFIMMLAP